MNLKFVGTQRNLALYESRNMSVVVNTKNLTASVLGDNTEIDRARIQPTREDPVWADIAHATATRETSPSSLDSHESFKRTYTVPKKVVISAEIANPTGPVSKRIASLLSSGEQISCEDVLWVSRFFTENNKDDTDRSTWLAWGGDDGKRWSQALSTRLDYDSVVADAGMYETPGVSEFVNGDETDRLFYAQLDEPMGQFVKTLYMMTGPNSCKAWGNGDWFSCDIPEPSPSLVELDDEAALYVAGALFDAPENPVDLRAPNPEAWDLVRDAYNNVDWTLVDRVMTAAVDPVLEGYTSEERSENVQSQVRDGNGRFVEIGATGAVKSSGLGGTVTAADGATGMVSVQVSDGSTVEIPSSDFEVGADPHPKTDPESVKDSIDFEGILSEAPEEAEPKATLAEETDRLGPVQIKEALDKYSEKITQSRQENAKEFKKILDDKKSKKGDGVLRAAGVVAEAAGAEPVADAASDVPPPSANPTPDSSDVDPVYIAIVAPDDPRAVMELVALVPATATTSEPKTFRRSGGVWIEDPSVLRDLRSPTPPPIVQLNADEYKEVLAQVDMETTEPDAGEGLPAAEEEQQTVTAAGGLDQNRGNAEDLRRYWTVGPGGLKIRWQTGGDWTRCVRLLSKYLGNRAKGYCALRHHEMTGMWPGDRKNREMSGPSITAAGAPQFSTTEIKTFPAVLRASADAAAYEVARSKVFGGYEYEPIPQSPEDISEGRSGRAFSIPLVIPEGLSTGDGRTFAKGALGIRTLPLPLMWQIQTGSGHDGAVLVGRIDRIERTKNGLGNAFGVFDTGPYAQEAQRLVDTKMLRWVSADLDKFEIDEDRSDKETGKMFIKKGRFMGATLVPKPAFQECTIELVPLEEKEMYADAVPSAISASASIARNIPVEPPMVWFDRPLLNGPSPITITDEGQVFGHIATWDRTHIGMAGDTRAPRSSSGYAYFHTGVLRTREGNDVRVGQLTLAGGHAPIHLDASSAVRHYDDTASSVADVHAGEDSFGIWVAGALRPGVSPEQIRALRASAPSGDWRAINRRLELVAVCQVNVPGFPVPRALAASGALTALVAAGTSQLAEMRAGVNDIKEFLDSDPNAVALALFEKMYNPEGYLTEFKDFSQEKRDKLAKEGLALPDGSFPIENLNDLRRAVHAYGRAEEGKKAKVRRHIVKRARALKKTDLVPSDWKELSLSGRSLDHRDKYETMVASARQEKVERLRARVAKPETPEELSARVDALRNRIQGV